MEKKTARNVTEAEHSPIGRVQVGTDCSNLDGKGAGVVVIDCMDDTHVMPEITRYVKEKGRFFTLEQIAVFMNLNPSCTHDLMKIIDLLCRERVLFLDYELGDVMPKYRLFNE